MKHYTLILTTLLSLCIPAQSWGDRKLIEGVFTCKIKYQSILEMKEGVPETYTGLGGKLSQGDTFELKYKYEEYLGIPDLIFYTGDMDQIKENKSPHIYTGGLAKTKRINTRGSYLRFWDLHVEPNVINSSIALERGGNIIEIKGGSRLTLKRYYKNDWSGIYNSNLMLETSNNQSNNQMSLVIGLDCRHTLDKLDEVIADLENQDY